MWEIDLFNSSIINGIRYKKQSLPDYPDKNTCLPRLIFCPAANFNRFSLFKKIS